ncbi:MAG TPA: hypothetical protein VII98_15100 [Solirubrobacteraceae bacterium]
MGTTTSGRDQRPRLGDALAQFGDAAAGVRTRRRLGATGLPATARLLSRSDIGGRLAGQPLCELGLEVSVPGHAPYTTIAREAFAPMSAPGLEPGATVAVRVDPHDPTIVVLDLQDGPS